MPAGTQVAAPPAEGEKDPVIFETERELTVTAAQLAALFVRDPEHDMQADLSPIITASAITSGSAVGERVFQGNRPIEHLLYLGHSQLLGFPRIAALSLLFTLEAALQDAREVCWEIWDGQQWQARTPSNDQTQNLTHSGVVTLGSIPPIPDSQVATRPQPLAAFSSDHAYHSGKRGAAQHGARYPAPEGAASAHTR